MASSSGSPSAPRSRTARVCLADEPTGELDAENARRLFELIGDLVRSEKTTTVLVASHEAGRDPRGRPGGDDCATAASAAEASRAEGRAAATRSSSGTAAPLATASAPRRRRHPCDNRSSSGSSFTPQVPRGTGGLEGFFEFAAEEPRNRHRWEPARVEELQAVRRGAAPTSTSFREETLTAAQRLGSGRGPRSCTCSPPSTSATATSSSTERSLCS